jgi:hypothetical protein
MEHEVDASEGKEGSTGQTAHNVVEIDKRPLIRKGELKRGSEESEEHSRSNVIEIRKRSIHRPILSPDTLKI